MCDALRQVVTLDELHDEGRDAGRFLDRVDRRDVRVVQGREGLCFTLEAREAVGVGGATVDRGVRSHVRRQPQESDDGVHRAYWR